MEAQNLAQAVKYTRENHGWSQAELGKRAHVSQSHIAKIEMGSDVRFSTVQRVMGSLGLLVAFAAYPKALFADRRDESTFASAMAFGVDLASLERSYRMSPKERFSEAVRSANGLREDLAAMSGLDPLPLLKALSEENAEYVLIGGLAAALMGTTRVTRDIDIAYARYYKNLERVCRALNRFEPREKILGKAAGAVFSMTPKVLVERRVVQLVTTVGEIALLDTIAGFHSFAQVKRLAHIEDIGLPVQVLGIDGLLKTKRALKRPKDMYDIMELEALKAAGEPPLELRIRPPDA